MRARQTRYDGAAKLPSRESQQNGLGKPEPLSHEHSTLTHEQVPDVLSSIDQLLTRPRKKKGRVALALSITWIVLVVSSAIFADLLPLRPSDAILQDISPRSGPRLSFNEPLGTDSLNRSTASRLVYGARQSLVVGLASVGMALIMGLVIGMTAGYFKRTVDTVISVFLDAMLAIPALVLLLAVGAVGKRDISTVVVGLAIVFTPTFARLARAHTIALAQREYISAARAMGAGHLRILLRELMPNVILPVSSYVFLVLGIAIVAEASLSFLGMGIPPPAPSWGGMVQAGRQFLETAPSLVFVPAVCLIFTVLSFTMVGDRARRHFDGGESALS